MNEDAFARRFYADRSELESLRIQLTVERPADGAAEQENYSLRPENFHLPAIEFTDKELAALQTALSLLDGEFAYAEPLRLALQQITWGRPEPAARARAAHRLRWASPPRPAATSCRRAWRRSRRRSSATRRSCSSTTRWSGTRSSRRKVDPYHLLFQGGQFYLLGYSHERKAVRVFRLSRIRGKVSYATKAEHDFHRPADFDPRAYANRADWQLGRGAGGRAGAASPSGSPGRSNATSAATARSATRASDAGGESAVFRDRLLQPAQPRSPGCWAWARTRACSARPSSRRSSPRRLELLEERHGEAPPRSPRRDAARREPPGRDHRRLALARAQRATRRRRGRAGRPDAAIRPERFARLVTLASILIKAGRAGERVVDRGDLRAPADQRGGAARGPQRAQRRQLRRRLLRSVRGDQGGGGGDRGRPGALQRQLRPAGPPAAGGGQGAGRGDRPDRRAHPRGLADLRAREDRGGARRGPDGAGPAGGGARRRRLGRGRARSPRRSPARG